MSVKRLIAVGMSRTLAIFVTFLSSCGTEVMFNAHILSMEEMSLPPEREIFEVGDVSGTYCTFMPTKYSQNFVVGMVDEAIGRIHEEGVDFVEDATVSKSEYVVTTCVTVEGTGLSWLVKDKRKRKSI
jgi:hypothetical protein